MSFKTYAHGFPRLGKNREFKRNIEAFWKEEISEEELTEALDSIQRSIIDEYSILDYYPVGEITGYDNILDTALMFNFYPKPSSWKEYYSYVRKTDSLEISKWFNTNYHYVVPEIMPNMQISLSWNKPLAYLEKFGNSKSLPFVVGPFTLIKLSKGKKSYDTLLDKLILEYSRLFSEIKNSNYSGFIHIDEPAIVYELSEEEISFIKNFYKNVSGMAKLIVFSYYDYVEYPVLENLLSSGIEGIGLDFVHDRGENLKNISTLARKGLLKDKILVVGIVDGRNVWKDNLERQCEKILNISEKVSDVKEIWLSNASPLFHLPISTSGENNLDPSIKERLAFAEEKLHEILLLKRYIEGDKSALEWNSYKYDNSWWFNKQVQEKVKSIKELDTSREKPYHEREKIQREILNLPLFPTTTIGSFPQTDDVRVMRQKFKKGQISKQEYDNFIKEKIKYAIKVQEDLGLDILVHGEFERSDMVEFFAEKLNGITTTENGWVLSYGTRIYRAPIIFGDVFRSEPLTLNEILYAQSLTSKPVKGMLTGPVTILAWSYGRTDIPESELAYQIALALNDEVKDLEKNGLKIIQIDEPAFREKAPIKRKDWDEYFSWAIKAFRLASKAKPETQIHTHMCYSEFGEIIDKIYQLDADVISIETTRSKGDIISSFESFNYDHQIGLGVYDVHSPEIPSKEKIRKILDRTLSVIDPNNFWINPDCGLKTRKWEEVIPSLKNIIDVTLELRKQYASKTTSK